MGIALLGRRRARRASKASTKGEDGEGACVSCDKHTDEVATVYLGKQIRDASGAHTVWQPHTRHLCADCVAQELDSNGYRLLTFVALQICWLPLLSRGISPLGLGGALIAAYGLYRLLQEILGLTFRRMSPKGKPPAWVRRRDSDEERASEALREIMRTEAIGQGLVIETVREYSQDPRHKPCDQGIHSQG